MFYFIFILCAWIVTYVSFFLHFLGPVFVYIFFGPVFKTFFTRVFFAYYFYFILILMVKIIEIWLNFYDSDCIGSYESNYHKIMTMATPDILTNICTTCFDNKKFSLSNFYSVLYLFFRFQLLPDSGNGKPLVCGERMSEQRKYSPIPNH